MPMSNATGSRYSYLRVGDSANALDIDIATLPEVVAAEYEQRDAGEQAFIDGHTRAAQIQTLGPPSRMDPNNLAEVRWGIIWPVRPFSDGERAHEAALRALIEHRQRQVGGAEIPQFYYQQGWTADDFLFAEGRRVKTGTMQCGKVPY